MLQHSGSSIGIGQDRQQLSQAISQFQCASDAWCRAKEHLSSLETEYERIAVALKEAAAVESAAWDELQANAGRGPERAPATASYAMGKSFAK